MSIPFLQDLKIKRDKMPKYKEFNKEFKEPLDYKLCNILLHSKNELLSPKVKSNFKKIVKALNGKNVLKTKWDRNYQLGRYYANNDISITPHSKKIKHTVYSYLGWLDIDMVKGHQSIAYEISKQRNKPLVNVGTILMDFQSYSNEVKSFYQDENEPLLQDDDVKDLNNLTIYGGSY